tara:strand:+ start:764 stop:1219 length:456 start_codon:yes stop_codon:yes gene_type:complete
MECSICADTLEDGVTHRLECGHIFHAACICRWFRQGNPTCPECRDVGEAYTLTWLDSDARASELRRRARSNTAPKRLKELVEKLQKSEKKYKELRKQMSEFRKNNIKVFQQWAKFRPKLFAASRSIRKNKRILGNFASPEFPVPNIRRPDQ